MVAEIIVISTGETQWASNPLTGAFQELPDTYLFKPTQYLDPTGGFFPSLGTGTVEVVLVGQEELEEVPGLPLTHLSGTIPGSVISDVSGGLINIDSLAADMWVDTASGEVHRVVLTDTAGQFVLANVPAGAFIVNYTADGYGAMWQSGSVGYDGAMPVVRFPRHLINQFPVTDIGPIIY